MTGILHGGGTAAFFCKDSPASEPLIIFHHIEKTAGTALRHVIRANLPPSDVEIARLNSIRYQPDRLRSWYADWYGSLAEERRARLCCVVSHSAAYLLPAVDRATDMLVVVREPVDRVLSFYYYKLAVYSRRPDPKPPRPSLEALYASAPDEAPRYRPQLFNWQSRLLLSVFYDVNELPFSAGPSPDADLWRERLRELVTGVYFVGVHDRLEQYVALLARRYGWSRLTISPRKVNAQRPSPSQVPVALRETIVACNWLDAELYQLCRETQERRESDAHLQQASP